MSGVLVCLLRPENAANAFYSALFILFSFIEDA